MVQIITVKVSKGGVGKTTICSNLAYLLSQKGHRVLIVDLDAQSNLTKSFVRAIDESKPTSSNLLGDDDFVLGNSVYNVSENLDIVGSDIGLGEVAKYLEDMGNYHLKLHEKLRSSMFSDYKYVFLDLSPGVADVLTQVAIASSDLLLCPTHFDIDSLTGLILTIEDATQLHEAGLVQDSLNYLVVPNRHDLRFKTDNQKIIDMLYENLDEDLIAQPIRENSHIKKARMFGKSAIEYELEPARKYEHKKAVEDFENLANKVMEILK